MVYYFCDTLVNLKDLLFKKKYVFEVEKNVNFRGNYFCDSNIFEIFRRRKSAEFNFANSPRIRENFFSRKYLTQKFHLQKFFPLR